MSHYLDRTAIERYSSQGIHTRFLGLYQDFAEGLGKQEVAYATHFYCRLYLRPKTLSQIEEFDEAARYLMKLIDVKLNDQCSLLDRIIFSLAAWIYNQTNQ